MVLLQLLGEVILERSNFTVMMQYISDPANLVTMMRLLKDSSKVVQFEAFHVFKVFVANPNKSAAVLEIFESNRDRLIKFLQGFKSDRGTCVPDSCGCTLVNVVFHLISRSFAW